jgi:hypothetical protein
LKEERGNDETSATGFPPLEKGRVREGIGVE